MRETRVLGRVLEAERRERSRRRWRRGFGVSATALAAAAATALWFRAAPAPDTSATRALAASSQPAPSSVLSFVDGSKALLSPGARVHTERQTDREVALLQQAGKVRYEVTPDGERQFTVRAAGIDVHVIGTIFTVKVEPSTVEVTVERGRVRVHDGERNVELGPSETLSILSADQHPPLPNVTEELRGERPRPPPSADELLAKADKARKSGGLSEAAAALRQLVSQYPNDARTVSAWFTLGRVHRAQGRHAEAAQAFRSAWSRAPSGSLAEDALAEEATSWASAGNRTNAIAAANKYMARYASGTHADRMRRLLQ